MRARIVRKHGVVLGCCLVVTVVVATLVIYAFGGPSSSVRVEVGRGVYDAQIARTPESREQGLSGTASLEPPAAMLLVFDYEAAWGIWMKDMNYAIDIVWISSRYEVVHIEENVSPDTYPLILRPASPARYVLEVSSGTVMRDEITVGQRVSMDVGE